MIDATSIAAPLYLLLFRIYYRLIMDKEGQLEFSKISPPFGGRGSSYFEVLFKENLLSVEVIVDWCSLLGVKNKDVIQQMVETVQLKYGVFNDKLFGFFFNVREKMEELCELMLKEKKPDYFLFLKDILYNLSLFIQCMPTVG